MECKDLPVYSDTALISSFKHFSGLDKTRIYITITKSGMPHSLTAAFKAFATSEAVSHCPMMQLMEVAANTAMKKSTFILVWLKWLGVV